MIIVSGGIKGGSGKTTIATHLAILRAQSGYDVLLIDADDQETSFDFSTLRSSIDEDLAQYTCIKLTGKAIRTEILKMKDKYTDIIVDAGGRDTINQRAALTTADQLVIPFVPRSFDLWTLENVAAITTEIHQVNSKLQAFTFLNRADARGGDNLEAKDILHDSDSLKMLDVVIGNRKAFGNAAAEGKAVNELKYPDKKAIIEIETLYNAIYK